MRKFEIVEKQSRMSVTPTGTSITQFQYLRWQENAVPNSTSAIIGNCQPGAESADEHWKQTYCRHVQVSCTRCFYIMWLCKLLKC